MIDIETAKNLESFYLRFDLHRRRIIALWKEAGSPNDWVSQKKLLKLFSESVPEVSFEQSKKYRDWLFSVKSPIETIYSVTHTRKYLKYYGYSFDEYLELIWIRLQRDIRVCNLTRLCFKAVLI